ncbi:translation machinery-associated protein 20 [Saccharomycopsis crataegensis]|uniref:Translation machinery-associated protein 20 n=1 Tax=Saccharomycopsis crataegensis TaxID=43959 RepID=A0AAV5QSI4_9ASCO|nr:translation machinery-associated protein 20 [Saccharomycopsis crataegensis]
MFKKFTKEDIHTKSNIKSSVQRGLKSKFAEQFPLLNPVIDDIIPKKSQMIHIKCEEKISLYAIDDTVVVYQIKDELFPSLHVVHKYPQLFHTVQVDRGAIKFVLGGANIMCPGLTSKGAQLPEGDELHKDDVVIVKAEGKENALAVGKLVMDVQDIKNLNKGIGIELIHYLGDGLWNLSLM